MVSGLQFVAITPSGPPDPSLAIAASRAGGLGVLDLEFTNDTQAALDALAQLARHSRNEFGIKVSSDEDDLLARAMSAPAEGLGVVLVASSGLARLQAQVATLHHRSLKVFVVATCLDEALAASDAGADGIVAKGHEAGGWVGEKTSFVLLQQIVARISLPVWVQGGIGLHTAAACYVAGAAGVVLDSQLLLTRESPLSDKVRDRIGSMDGSETVCLGNSLGDVCRAYARPNSSMIAELHELETELGKAGKPKPETIAEWRMALGRLAGWSSVEKDLLMIGQDAAFAAPLARRFRTVSGIMDGMRKAVEEHCRAARTLCPLAEGSPLAESHGTRYPIVQGPMTRVSDKAQFALRVAENGALPFLALALMRGPQVKSLLEETKALMGERPWGVGILGFVPIELRQEQLAAIRECSPPYALIAGGRPDQARSLEQEGIPSYLHVPSPGLLRLFLQDGARRFVFEGRECGGHVGPRSSFVLWETMVEVLLEWLGQSGDPSSYHVLFAGGIHDALSSAVAATVGAPLAELGVRVGVLMGTGYLFSKEAVEAGAITKGYQEESIRCTRTVLLETGPGHSTRVVDTPYVATFQQAKQEMATAGLPGDEIRNSLEELNLGRLRMATKGIKRNPDREKEPGAQEFLELSEEEQHAQGTYMIGQIAALRDRACGMADLHQEVSAKGSEVLRSLPLEAGRILNAPEAKPLDIAVVGMSCILPGAPDLRTFWENILNKVDAVREVSTDRWDPGTYFDPDPKAEDKVYSKWGGFLDDVPFDPVAYGIPPNSLRSIEPMQLLALEVAQAALRDAGYGEGTFDRERTSVVLGAGGGAGDLGLGYIVRSALPTLFGKSAPEIAAALDGQLPKWTEDTFPGVLMNVAAGRVANRLDFGGLNCTIDAACASSLAAVYLGVKDLETHSSDMVIVGGVDALQSPFIYLCFSKTEALSPSGQCRPYDAQADGIAISEGVVALVLKRLSDAERDSDQIYGVIQGIGASSDGRSKALTAPLPEGQVRALRRAYARAGISPASVELIEGHGTGTVAGDQAEVMALTQFFQGAQAQWQSCALGSVKSMIGHTKCAAGVASLIKVCMALHHKVLPPTLGVTRPNPKANFSESPFYVNSEARPWISSNGHPRTAGVSAFGFGGTNFHIVVEEYTGGYLDDHTRAGSLQQWPSELFIWRASSRESLVGSITPIENVLADGARPVLRDLAATLSAVAASADDGKLCLAIVAGSIDDLRQKLASAREALADPANLSIDDPRGIYYAEEPLASDGRMAFLFPGQGSQYTNMLRDLANQFPQVGAYLQRADETLRERLPRPLSSYVFPPPAFTEAEADAAQQALTQTQVAQPALGAAELAMLALLKKLGVHADCIAGHSYGEFVALCAAGSLNEDDLIALSEARGRFILEESGPDSGAMAAISADREAVAELIQGARGTLVIANLNSPRQTVISGEQVAVDQVVEACEAQGIPAARVPVGCAFHSPLVARAQAKLAEYLSGVRFESPQVEVFSNTTAAAYPREPQAIVELLAEHLIQPVNFVDEIEALYRSGARTFVEVGPRSVLTRLADEILGDKQHLAVAVDQPGRHGLSQLQHLLGQLAAHGVPVRLDPLYRGRSVKILDLSALDKETGEKALSPTTWLVNGGGARPLAEAVTERSTPLQIEVFRNGQTDTPVPPAPSAVGGHSIPTPVLDNHPAAKGPPAANGSADQIVTRYQQLMSQFLDTQKSVMLEYLDSRSSRSPTVDEYQSRAAEKTAPPRLTSPMQEVATTPDPEPQELHVEASITEAPEPLIATASKGHQPVETALDEATLTRRLVAIVSERTGYPVEMIDLDSDLEADLGIDSIKRVEILGTLKQVSPEPEVHDTDLESLSASKTLRAIVDAILSGRDSKPPPHPSEAPPQARDADAEEPSRLFEAVPEMEAVQRFTLQVTDTPISTKGAYPVSGRVLILTDDQAGSAQAVAEALRGAGASVVMVRMGDRVQEIEPGDYQADVTSAEQVARLVDLIRQRQGSVGGLAHLLPLKPGLPFDRMDLAAWKERLDLDEKSLFLLSNALADDLSRAVGDGGALLLAATAMGGTFGTGGAADQIFAFQSGVAGFVKSVALEWPGVRVKAVDLDPTESPKSLAAHLLQEMGADDGETEVGYAGARRVTLQPVLAPIDGSTVAELEIDGSSVILLTGGARGITSEVAIAFAERYKPTLLLVGRTPLPGQESAETSGLNDPHQLKAALIEQLGRSGQRVVPAAVEVAYNHLRRDREIRGNIAALERAGARVRYYQADVRDEEAFGVIIDDIYRTHGRLDGVVHGAGVIEDKLVKDKTPDSFDRVFGTKTASSFILSRRLRPDSLKFFVLFSSIAARFGNGGQADYAGANAVLNDLAGFLDRRWPGRIVSINWGPWLAGSMVSPEVSRQFAERGVELIPPAVGRRMLEEELRYGRKGEAEVLIGGGWQAARPPHRVAHSSSALPLLGNRAAVGKEPGGAARFTYTLDPDRDLYLRDHCLDGQPVLPMAMAMELVAEASKACMPDLDVVGVRDLQMLRGLVVRDGLKPILVSTREQVLGSDEGMVVEATIADADDAANIYYRATVDLRRSTSPDSIRQPGALEQASPFPMSTGEAYRNWLFHGPLLQGIQQVLAAGPKGFSTILRPSSPQKLLADGGGGSWLIDPVVVDCALQLQLMWSRMHWDMNSLPSRIQCFKLVAPLAGEEVRCETRVRPDTIAPVIRADHYFFGSSGQMLGVLEGVEHIASKVLNRVADEGNRTSGSSIGMNGGGHQRRSTSSGDDGLSNE